MVYFTVDDYLSVMELGFRHLEADRVVTAVPVVRPTWDRRPPTSALERPRGKVVMTAVELRRAQAAHAKMDRPRGKVVMTAVELRRAQAAHAKMDRPRGKVVMTAVELRRAQAAHVKMNK